MAWPYHYCIFIYTYFIANLYIRFIPFDIYWTLISNNIILQFLMHVTWCFVENSRFQKLPECLRIWHVFLLIYFAVREYKFPCFSTWLGTMCDFSIRTACQSKLYKNTYNIIPLVQTSNDEWYVIFCNVTDLKLEAMSQEDASHLTAENTSRDLGTV
jgi:ABC-type transport system involved in cytochrome c biogenesis permease subunit